MVIEFLANGFEEVEALTPLDLLRRAGVEVVTVAIGSQGDLGRRVTGSHGISVLADVSEQEFSLPDTIEMVVLPGGMPGAVNLDASPVVEKTLQAAAAQNAWLSAICAAPLVLGRRGYLNGHRATCYPGFEEELRGAVCVSDGCVISDNSDGDSDNKTCRVITAAGMGVAYTFGLSLVKVLRGEACANQIAAAVMDPSLQP